MFLFAFATLCPVALLLLAVLWGGVMPLVALGYMTVLVFGLDRLIAVEAKNSARDAEFPAADALLYVLGLSHLVLLVAAVWAVAGPSGLSALNRVLIAVTAGMIFGQVSHPVAHELIHRPGRGARLLGRLIYSTLLFGHHASAHLLVHHIHVGSDADPNSPRLGRGFYRYALRAGIGSFRAALRAETARHGHGQPRAAWRHPFVFYTGVAMLSAAGAGAALGWAGFGAFVAIVIYAQMQILLSDYVQHYGLRRKVLDNGKLEPVGPQHSWNAPHWYSSALMVNAPRHSDHHTTPTRPYPALQLQPGTMPMLPLPVPMMAAIALVPPLWRSVMDRRVAEWA